MALPILGGLAWMLGNAWARDAYGQSQREQGAEAFRSGVGERSGLDYPTDITGGLVEGPPQFVPGSGLLGATRDPQQQAFLELAAKMAGSPGVRPQDLLGIAQRVTELGAAEGLQSKSLQQRWQEMLAGQDFQREDRASEQDFRWAQSADDRDFRAGEARLEREARDAARRGDYRHAFALQNRRFELEAARDAGKGPDLGKGKMLYTFPGGASIPGPQPGEPEYATGVKEVRSMSQAVNRIDNLLESFHDTGRGREYFGETAGDQAALYGRLIADIAQAENKGVLQPGELAEIKERYPSPQSFFDKVQTDEYLFGVFNRLRRDFADSYETRRQMYPWTRAIPGMAPDPGALPTRESVAAKRGGRELAPEVQRRLRPYGGARRSPDVYREPGAGELSR